MSSELQRKSRVTPESLNPLHDRAIVEMDDREGVSAGGIVIPEAARDVPLWGTVKAVGPEAVLVFPGDRVYVPRTSGTAVNLNGAYYLLVREGCVLCKEEAAA